MKFTNKTLIALGLIATTGLFFTSCNKTITPRKLDGTWNVTSGSGTYTYESDFQETMTTSTYNGTVMTTTGETDFDPGGTVDIDQETTISYTYTFDRSTGEYTMTSVSSSTVEDDFASGSYYEFDDNLQAYVYAGNYVTTTERTETSTESGFFTITGDAGDDIEANSQIVFQMTNSTSSFTETYTYEDEEDGDDLSASSTYVQGEFNPVTFEYDYDRIETDDEGNTSTSGTSANAPIWNVVETDGDDMMVEWTSESNFVDQDESDNNTTSKTTTEWTLTQE